MTDSKQKKDGELEDKELKNSLLINDLHFNFDANGLPLLESVFKTQKFVKAKKSKFIIVK